MEPVVAHSTAVGRNEPLLVRAERPSVGSPASHVVGVIVSPKEVAPSAMAESLVHVNRHGCGYPDPARHTAWPTFPWPGLTRERHHHRQAWPDYRTGFFGALDRAASWLTACSNLLTCTAR